MNKLLGQRKQFNLAAASTAEWSSSDDESPASVPVLQQFLVQREQPKCIAECTTDSCSSSEECQIIDTSDALETSIYCRPRVRRQRTTSQRSTKSGGSVATVPVTRTTSDYLNDTSDDEAFMNNPDNFEQSPTRQRRNLRKRKTSSLKRRAGVQRVPETPVPVVIVEQRQVIDQPELRNTVSPLDTTLDMSGDLSLQWIENEMTESKSADSGCHVISEKSFLVANAETEDALDDDYSDNPAAAEVFKMPFPVAYRPNLCKRRLSVESDEEFITTAFRAPLKRHCIRY